MKPNILAEPDFADFERALRLRPAKRIHQFDFNIHQEIKEAVLGRKILTGKDEVEFWQCAGYDYVQVRLKPENAGAHRSVAQATAHGNLETLEQLLRYHTMGLLWIPTA